MSDLKNRGLEIGCTAPRSVNDLIASLGRTEDVCFSPNNRRLAVAAFLRNRIAVFDIDIATSAAGPHVTLTGGVELSSPALNSPHGLDFIDDETLIVANRAGGVALFKLPTGEVHPPSYEVLPIQTWPADGKSLLESPSSVAVTSVARGLREILICNNTGHSVSRHHLDVGGGCVVRSGEVLLRKWLDIPDGVRVSPDRRWIAVSNHSTHDVLLYENVPSLNKHADPAGILRRALYPHGLRFTPDGRHLFVADAGAPNVHVYAGDGDGWWGVRHPVATIRIMDDSLFERGRDNPEEGGPKGLDIDVSSNVLVVTSEYQPLAFFYVPALLDRASGNPLPAEGPYAARARGAINGEMDDGLYERSQREQQALDVRYELSILAQNKAMKTRAMKAEALVSSMRRSWSWRLTAPLRLLQFAWRRLTVLWKTLLPEDKA